MQCSSDLNQFINEQIDLLDKCIFFESHTEASIQTEILQCYTENTEANLTDIEYTNMVSIIREEYCKNNKSRSNKWIDKGRSNTKGSFMQCYRC